MAAVTSKWIRGSRGAFRCRYKCCHIGGRCGLAQAKRGHARAVRRAARLAIEDEVDGREAEAALEAFEASGEETVPTSDVMARLEADLGQALDDVAAKLIKESVPLDSEAARILYANLWKLY